MDGMCDSDALSEASMYASLPTIKLIPGESSDFVSFTLYDPSRLTNPNFDQCVEPDLQDEASPQSSVTREVKTACGDSIGDATGSRKSSVRSAGGSTAPVECSKPIYSTRDIPARIVPNVPPRPVGKSTARTTSYKEAESRPPAEVSRPIRSGPVVDGAETPPPESKPPLTRGMSRTIHIKVKKEPGAAQAASENISDSSILPSAIPPPIPAAPKDPIPSPSKSSPPKPAIGRRRSTSPDNLPLQARFSDSPAESPSPKGEAQDNMVIEPPSCGNKHEFLADSPLLFRASGSVPPSIPLKPHTPTITPASSERLSLTSSVAPTLSDQSDQSSPPMTHSQPPNQSSLAALSQSRAPPPTSSRRTLSNSSQVVSTPTSTRIAFIQRPPARPMGVEFREMSLASMNKVDKRTPQPAGGSTKRSSGKPSSSTTELSMDSQRVTQEQTSSPTVTHVTAAVVESESTTGEKRQAVATTSSNMDSHATENTESDTQPNAESHEVTIDNIEAHTPSEADTQGYIEPPSVAKTTDIEPPTVVVGEQPSVAKTSDAESPTMIDTEQPESKLVGGTCSQSHIAQPASDTSEDSNNEEICEFPPPSLSNIAKPGYTLSIIPTCVGQLSPISEKSETTSCLIPGSRLESRPGFSLSKSVQNDDHPVLPSPGDFSNGVIQCSNVTAVSGDNNGADGVGTNTTPTRMGGAEAAESQISNSEIHTDAENTLIRSDSAPRPGQSGRSKHTCRGTAARISRPVRSIVLTQDRKVCASPKEESRKDNVKDTAVTLGPCDVPVPPVDSSNEPALGSPSVKGMLGNCFTPKNGLSCGDGQTGTDRPSTFTAVEERGTSTPIARANDALGDGNRSAPAEEKKLTSENRKITDDRKTTATDGRHVTGRCHSYEMDGNMIMGPHGPPSERYGNVYTDLNDQYAVVHPNLQPVLHCMMAHDRVENATTDGGPLYYGVAPVAANEEIPLPPYAPDVFVENDSSYFDNIYQNGSPMLDAPGVWSPPEITSSYNQPSWGWTNAAVDATSSSQQPVTLPHPHYFPGANQNAPWQLFKALVSSQRVRAPTATKRDTVERKRPPPAPTVRNSCGKDRSLQSTPEKVATSQSVSKFPQLFGCLACC